MEPQSALEYCPRCQVVQPAFPFIENGVPRRRCQTCGFPVGAALTQPPPPVIEAAQRGIKILCVDDDPLLLRDVRGHPPFPWVYRRDGPRRGGGPGGGRTRAAQPDRPRCDDARPRRIRGVPPAQGGPGHAGHPGHLSHRDDRSRAERPGLRSGGGPGSPEDGGYPDRHQDHRGRPGPARSPDPGCRDGHGRHQGARGGGRAERPHAADARHLLDGR